jgi:hypothetical protein
MGPFAKFIPGENPMGPRIAQAMNPTDNLGGPFSPGEPGSPFAPYGPDSGPGNQAIMPPAPLPGQMGAGPGSTAINPGGLIPLGNGTWYDPTTGMIHGGGAGSGGGGSYGAFQAS